MPTPAGHLVFAYTLARELGFTRGQSGLSAVFSTLPDIDMPLGVAHRGDLYAYHRAGTHTLPFAAAAGVAAYASHRVLRPAAGGRAAETAGVLVYIGVASHLVADAPRIPTFNRREPLTHERVTRDLRLTLALESLNVLVELALFGIPALLLRNRGRFRLHRWRRVVP